MDFVRITWIDASDPDATVSWYGNEELEKFGDEVTLVESFGYLLKKTKLYYTLVADNIRRGVSEPTWGRPTKIPVRLVVGYHVLPLPPPDEIEDEAEKVS